METLKISPVDKTHAFHCSFEGNNCLVKTGSKEGIFTSFLNSILIACSKDFKYLNNNEKYERICRVRDSLFIKINKNMWKIEGIKHFKKVLLQNIKDYYEFINTTNKVENNTVKKIGKKLIQNKKQFELFKIIVELLPYEEITNFETETNNIEEYKEEIIEHVIQFLQTLEILNEFSEENIDYILKNISEFIKTVLNESEYESYRNYKYNVTDIDDIFINTVSDYFGYNIYFISAETRLPYILNNYEKMNNINSIILLSFINKHFEIVGSLQHDNSINRIFMYDHPIIKKFNKIINKPNLPLEEEENQSTEEENKNDSDAIVENENDTNSEIKKDSEAIVEKENDSNSEIKKEPEAILENLTNSENKKEHDAILENDTNSEIKKEPEAIVEKEHSKYKKEDKNINLEPIKEEYKPKKLEIKRYIDESSSEEYSSESDVSTDDD